MRCIGRLALAVLLVASGAFANVVLTLDYVYSGTLPSNYLVATFADTATDTVTLTLDTTHLAATAYVSEWDFNVKDVFLSPSSLTFTPATGVLISKDSYKADGDGMYDISVTTRLNGGATYLYTITGNGLTAADFELLSVKNPTSTDYKGPFFSAAHVQDKGGVHAWIGTQPVPTVPDGGTTVMLLGGALVVVESVRRRFWV